MKSCFNNDDFYIYYLRDTNRNPFGCVALRRDKDGNWARGISICSSQDQFIKEKAKRLSKGRCIKALFSKQSTDPIQANDKDVMCLVGNWHNSPKSAYSVSLTEQELQITKSNDKPVFEGV